MGDVSSVRAKFALVAMLAVPVCVLFIPLLAIEASSWDSGRPSVEIGASSWRVVYGSSPESCDEVVTETPGCLANPSDKALWASPTSRADAGHAARLEKLAGGEFWLGATIGVDRLAQARKLEANQFLLGFIAGSYRVWVDGELLLEGSHATTRLPVVLPLPMPRLEQNRPLKIAVQVFHDAGVEQPDSLGGATGEGFATMTQARYYVYKTLFWNEARPWFFFGADVLIAVFFLLLWSAARRKQEYFYVGLYALAHAFLELHGVGLINRGLGAAASARLELVLRAYEGVFGLMLGLSFSRARRAFFAWGVPIGLVAPWPFAAASTAFQLTAAAVLARWISPALHVLGAAACLVQAAYLFGLGGEEGTQLTVRARRVALFGACLLGLAAVRVAAAGAGAAAAGPTAGGLYNELTSWGLLDRLAHFGLLVFLCGLVMREYREQEMLSARTAISDYHRRPFLVESLKGVALVVDIKRSEWLFRSGARLGDSERLSSLCLSQMWLAVNRHLGVVLQTEGDRLQAFFPAERCSSPVIAALRTVDEMSEALTRLARQFHEQGVMPRDASLVFRGGLCEGAVRPIWVGGRELRHPAWTPAAGSPDVLARAARLMELEPRVVEAGEPRTLVLLPERLLPGSGPREPVERAAFEQDGEAVAVYVPGAEARPRTSAASPP